MVADGFITKEEWIDKGRDPELWRSEEEFVKRGEEILPIVQENNKRLTEKLSTMESDMQKILEFNKAQEEKLRKEGYEKAIKEIEAQKKKAFDADDWDGVKEADKQKDEIVKEHIEKEAEIKAENKQEPDPEFDDWKSRNSWYQDDTDLQGWADEEGAALLNAKMGKGKSRTEALDYVSEIARKLFPEKFENKNRDKAGAVETEGSTKNKRGNGKTFDDLPDSAKKQYEKLKGQFALKGRKYEKKDYVANYDFD